jgi:hypothetical protein
MRDNLWGLLWLVVPVAAIIGWVVVSTTRNRDRHTGTDQVAAALVQTAETNRQLTARIDQLDQRLASIEKTLNEIP